MSLMTKICANIWSNGWKTVCKQRSFHMLSCALPKPAALPSTIAASVPATNFITQQIKGLLVPFNSLLTQVAGFKVKGRLKRRCKDCYFVIRQRRHYVICPTHPRHKQMSMMKRDYKTWILTHATQSKERGY